MGEHSYLYWYISPFPTKTPVTPEWMGAAFCKFVYVLRSYNRTKWKKNQRKRVKTHTCIDIPALFLPKPLYLRNGWAQHFANSYTHFVAIIEQNKKRIKENEWKLVPVLIYQPFSYQNPCNSGTVGRSLSQIGMRIF